MATTLTMGTLRNAVGWSFEETQTWGNSSNSSSFTYSTTLANGTGAAAANKLYVVQNDTGISASSSTTLDLQSLTDMFGTATSFSKVRVFYIENTTSTVGVDMVIGDAAATEWINAAALLGVADSTLLLPAGACFCFLNPSAAGWAVAAGYKSLKLTNSSGTTALTYKLVLAGE